MCLYDIRHPLMGVLFYTRLNKKYEITLRGDKQIVRRISPTRITSLFNQSNLFSSYQQSVQHSVLGPRTARWADHDRCARSPQSTTLLLLCLHISYPNLELSGDCFEGQT